jgi:ATP-dependent Clp protease, protease subunit
MEAAAALSTPRVAFEARTRTLFSPLSSLHSAPSPNLRLTARPRAVTAAKPRFLNPHPDPAGDGGRGARDVVAMVRSGPCRAPISDFWCVWS